MRIEEAWELQRRWSMLAKRTAGAIARWRAANLMLILLGSVLGALAAQLSGAWGALAGPLGAASALALAFAAFIQSRLLTQERIRLRIRSRAAAESLRGIVFQYLAKVPPFDGENRGELLGDRVGQVGRLTDQPGEAALLLAAAVDGRPLPNVAGIADYVRERAVDQRAWHARRAGETLALAKRWRGAQLAATAVATALAALGGVVSAVNLSTWVAVATTAAAALAAHLAASQYDRIADSYARTALALDALLAEFDPDTEDVHRAGRFVAATERVLAAENEAWVAVFSARAGGP